MKLLLFAILILISGIPSVMAHPIILHTHPAIFTPHTPEPIDTKEYQRDFFTILIGTIVITMLITVLVVYREDIPLINNQFK